MVENLERQLCQQRFANGYELVNGVAMHAQEGARFQIPPAVIKKHLAPGQFVELRIDSLRFSVHPQSPEKCNCPSCQGEATKPILCHEHPATLLPLPTQPVPSRGWGEDFWVRIKQRQGCFFAGTVDNPLYEARLHELYQGDEIVFHEDHILAIHGVHRQELVSRMDAVDLEALVQWLATQQR